MSGTDYVPALRYRWLTRFYDPVVRITTREAFFRAALLQQAAIGHSHRVLDVGCGTGTLAIAAQQARQGAEVVGIDGDPAILRIAEEKAKKIGVAVRFELGSATSLPYADATYNRVLSSLFFHHLRREDKLASLQEIRRVLNPGGELHVADWGKPQNPLMRVASLGVQILDGFKTTQDNVDGLLPALMKEAGFGDVQVRREIATMFGTLVLYRAQK